MKSKFALASAVLSPLVLYLQCPPGSSLLDHFQFLEHKCMFPLLRALRTPPHIPPLADSARLIFQCQCELYFFHQMRPRVKIWVPCCPCSTHLDYTLASAQLFANLCEGGDDITIYIQSWLPAQILTHSRYPINTDVE